MIKFPLIEFYITNVCNLTCRGCNRFNNLKLKGHEKWDDYADHYENWSKKIDIERITIIGGEPTLNPDLEKWCMNLRRLWPNSTIMLQTNGTHKQPEKFLQFWDKYKVGLGISLHDLSTKDEIIKKWKIGGFIPAFIFHQNALIEKDNHYILHDSNPIEAFINCDMRHDHTMFNGKLWKCPTVSLLPELLKQIDLRVSDEDLKLILGYKPLNHNCTDNEILEFISSRDKEIPNCKFCPAKIKWHTALGPLEEDLPNPEKLNESILESWNNKNHP